MENNKVLYNVDQSADTTSEQKRTARKNIGTVSKFSEVKAQSVVHTVTAAEASNGYFDIEISSSTTFSSGDFDDIKGALFAIEDVSLTKATDYYRDVVPVHVEHDDVRDSSYTHRYTAASTMSKVDVSWIATFSTPIVPSDTIDGIRLRFRFLSGDLSDGLQFSVIYRQYVQLQ